MWIKSQDGTELIETDRIQRDGEGIYVFLDTDNYLKIGVFKTEESAKREFERIEMAIIDHQRIYTIEMEGEK